MSNQTRDNIAKLVSKPLIDRFDGSFYAFDHMPYESGTDLIIRGVLGFCGCGDAYLILDMLKEVLPLIDKGEHTQRKNILTVDAYEQLVLHLLYKWDITEHGSSVGGSWLTPLGKKFMEYILEIDTENGN